MYLCTKTENKVVHFLGIRSSTWIR